MTKAARMLFLFAAALLPASSARAAGARSGVPAASEAAELRAPGSTLVEIEGFADPAGGIPCSGKSFSNSWHYKFYDGSDWLLINACGGDFLDAAKHFPENKDAEPVRTLPATFADSAEILQKLEKAGFFQGPSESFERDMLMRAAYLKEEGDRPAGCYWTVSRGKEKVLMDCDGKKQWTTGKTPAAGAKPGPAAKGKDPAARYAQLAIDTIRRKTPGARLMLIESLVDRTGSAKCIDPKDGWTYVFSTGGAAATSAFAGCRGKSTADYILFDGRNTGSLEKLEPIAPPFKDSDQVLSQVPADCVKNYSTISMKLQNFKPRYALFAGHSLVWTIDCGAHRHFVDGNTGKYLGGGTK